MRTWITAALVLGMAAPAQAAPRPHVTVSPARVVAGQTLTVKVTHGARCVLSVRDDRYGARARYRVRVRHGRAAVRVLAAWKAGRKLASVRCGSRHAIARFRVVRLSPVPLPAQPGPVAPAPPAPDEQGFVALGAGSQEDAPGGTELG